jgi:hypothetical protein
VYRHLLRFGTRALLRLLEAFNVSLLSQRVVVVQVLVPRQRVVPAPLRVQGLRFTVYGRLEVFLGFGVGVYGLGGYGLGGFVLGGYGLGGFVLGGYGLGGFVVGKADACIQCGYCTLIQASALHLNTSIG